MLRIALIVLLLCAPSAVAQSDLPTPDTTQSLFPLSPERQAELESYSTFGHIWRFISFAVGLGILALIAFTGWAAKFRDWAAKLRYELFAMWGFLALFLIAQYLLYLPFAIYRSFFVEHLYGFSNQSFWGWLSEDLLGLGLQILIYIIPMVLFYTLVRRTRYWWAWFSAAMLPVVVFFVIISPVYISPVFNDFTPIEDKQLESEILALAESVGIDNPDVFQVDASRQSNKINAYVTGLFGTKRIVLYDTMIENFDTDEILFVVGHEMGHYVMNHVWWGTLLTMLGLVAVLWLIDRLARPLIRQFSRHLGFNELGNMASLPVVMLLANLIIFIASPISSGVSRYMEHQCDVYGMDVTTADGLTAATTFEKLSAYNLSDPNPPAIIEFWFYSHPSLGKRIDFVTSYADELGR